MQAQIKHAFAPVQGIGFCIFHCIENSLYNIHLSTGLELKTYQTSSLMTKDNEIQAHWTKLLTFDVQL